MSSVASETSIFPPPRPLPGLRGRSETAGVDRDPGSFGKLLDGAPAHEREPQRTETKRAETKRSSDEPSHRDETAPADSSRPSNDSDVKNAKPTADAEKTSQAEPKTKPQSEAQAAPQSETQPVMQAGLQTASPVLPEATFLIAVQDAVGTASWQIEQGSAETTDTPEFAATDSATIPPAATPEAALPAGADTVAGDVQTSADAAPLAPVIAASAAEAAPAASATAALPEAATAPLAAGASPEAAQPAAAQAAEAQAAIAAAAGTAKPATEPSKVQPETSAAMPGDDAPVETKPELPPLQAARHDRPQSGPEDASVTLMRAAPHAPDANADAAADPFARVNDAANAVKASADLVQSLTAPGAHAAPTQSTAAAAAAAAAAPAQTPAAPVPVAGLAVEIATQALAGKNRFEIRLDPPELGRINVRIEIDGDGHVTSRLVVDRVETLELLRRDAPQLERALQQAGLKTADNALEFSLRQQATHQDRNDDSQPGSRLIAADDDAATIELAQHNYGRRFGLGGGIDIRV